MSRDDRKSNLFSIKSMFSLLTLTAVVGTLLWISFNVDLPDPQELIEIVQGYGWGGWIVFIIITALIAITPIPVTIPALVSGSLYGVIAGSLISFTGVLIGSWLGYWLARITGQQMTFKLLGKHGETVRKYLNNAGFLTMCTARLMPGLPYWPINYGAGALGISQYTFLSASFIASIPGQVSLVSLGAFAVNQSLFNGVILLSAWAAVLIGTYLSYRYWKEAQKSRRKLL